MRRSASKEFLWSKFHNLKTLEKVANLFKVEWNAYEKTKSILVESACLTLSFPPQRRRTGRRARNIIEELNALIHSLES
ncbi:MAG: hypothetical protein IIA61_08865 [Candidatus Marinimicrobia bacterium]|nr:hypothetical protein [Candidatus Neomarinimicrobiota bacterium]